MVARSSEKAVQWALTDSLLRVSILRFNEDLKAKPIMLKNQWAAFSAEKMQLLTENL